MIGGKLSGKRMILIRNVCSDSSRDEDFVFSILMTRIPDVISLCILASSRKNLAILPTTLSGDAKLSSVCEGNDVG